MEGDLRQAELYLLEANNAKAAINMYRVQNMWEDAYRVNNIYDRFFYYFPGLD